ncbi:hypothetical protein SAY86_021651 [Trapa natans]|uniref:Peptidyl-prolyl cis-trans isomerase n=1 Tax=Trapa natans TaxID=22666 RepID=A0AAN7MA46_TRANT|nr:hypothetical protein SAY86_021651 [Trapa natans]
MGSGSVTHGAIIPDGSWLAGLAMGRSTMAASPSLLTLLLGDTHQSFPPVAPTPPTFSSWALLSIVKHYDFADFCSRIVSGLYVHDVLKTVENFRALCTGEKGKGADGKSLHYKGTTFHLIIYGFVIQGGDIMNGGGKGYESIYCGNFADDDFKIKRSHPGDVSMVNTGPDSNGSQFFITTVKASWLDGEHVVFGKVIQGMDNVYTIEGGAVNYNGKPRKKVSIADSGEIPKSKRDEES